jgi:hypothetical protein
MIRARNLGFSSNLVYMGGVALNCTANRMLGEYFDKIWIMPCPGDAGSSLGAAALAFGRRVNWRDSYLGHCIPGVYPVNGLLDRLLTEQLLELPPEEPSSAPAHWETVASLQTLEAARSRRK